MYGVDSYFNGVGTPRERHAGRSLLPCFGEKLTKTPHFLQNTKGVRRAFPRGEGGPPERSEEKAGRMRNAGDNLVHYKM